MADKVKETYVGEINFLRYRDDHRWYWPSQQTP
jgi:hypothetical protein